MYVHRSSNSVSRLFKYTQTTQVRCPCRSVCCDASIVRHKNVDVHVVRFIFLSAMIKNTYIYRFNLKVRTRNRTDCKCKQLNTTINNDEKIVDGSSGSCDSSLVIISIYISIGLFLVSLWKRSFLSFKYGLFLLLLILHRPRNTIFLLCLYVVFECENDTAFSFFRDMNCISHS